MGYTTEFRNRFNLDKKLSDEDFNFLTKFNETRRMKRNLPAEYGIDGEFYVDGGGSFGQAQEESIVDYNEPPSTQPGLWCQWVPTEDRMGIEWDGGEKFYHYTEWIKYLIEKILSPRGYTLNGIVRWQGEDMDDRGQIEIVDNKVHEVYLD
jgi:hypothetical protein